MSVYTYPESRVIDEVTFKETEGGHARAYVHAASGSDSKSLYDITCALKEEGWQAVPFNLNGKPALEVQGFKSQAKFITFLEQRGWAQGKSTYVQGKEDVLNFKDKVKKRSLAASGAFYLIGDASFTKYGYAEKNPYNTAGGMLYGAGTLSLLVGGRRDQSDLQLRDISKRMAQYLKENGTSLPKECSLDSIIDDHKRGLIKKADDLLRRYPSELMNLFFAAAGACIAKAAYKSLKNPHVSDEALGQVYKRLSVKKAGLTEETVKATMLKNHKLESKLDIGLGTMTGLSGLFAMLVKEKAPDPDAPEKHGIAAVWEKIREKPLAIAGVGYMVSTMCHAVSTAIAWNYADNHRRNSVPFRAVFVGANIIAELLLAISSKGHGEGVVSDKSVDNTVIALAAELIAQQPAKLQNDLIEHVTRFLGKPEVLARKNEDIRAELHVQVEAMRKNPWAVAAGVSKEAVAPSAKPEKAPPVAAWQAKVAAAPDPSAQPQVSI